MIVGFTPGGGVDIIARLIGQWLSERLGQPFVIENRPGAGTNIATEAVVRAAPDGHTLLVSFSSNAINATLYNKLNFDFIRDTAPTAGIMRASNVVLLHPSVAATTVREFIDLAKANPGKLSMASGGNGTTAHLAGEFFKMMTDTNLVHVPYRGTAPAITDLIGGQVQVAFRRSRGRSNISGPVSSVRWRSPLTALGSITGPPNGTNLSRVRGECWYGLSAPKNTPIEIIDKLNKEISAALVDPKIKARIADLAPRRCR